MMLSPVTNPVNDDPLPERLMEYLKCCGTSSRVISKCTLETRLYHDLDIYGEIAEDYLEVLSEKFGVDLSGFHFDDFFPQEWPQGNSWAESLLLKVFPGIERLYRKPKLYAPITMRMLNTALEKKRLCGLPQVGGPQCNLDSQQ
ncbi:DUF1493 family protein [Massilia sp. PAMC28688]|uniref:DUF1493 family protein n=1 Tax=Massilia sp. PAMC28688 TaxID=2861283 RepID=UPI001C62F56D|nr:DUF1493 family protein [Massilia sp. PAMC28688]QYF94621.1 DUF1493 family protein [Massilia sp. PAMC28688]